MCVYVSNLSNPRRHAGYRIISYLILGLWDAAKIVRCANEENDFCCCYALLHELVDPHAWLQVHNIQRHIETRRAQVLPQMIQPGLQLRQFLTATWPRVGDKALGTTDDLGLKFHMSCQ